MLHLRRICISFHRGAPASLAFPLPCTWRIVMRGVSKDSACARYEVALRTSVRADLSAWATYVMARSGQSPAAHHLLLLSYLAKVSRGEIDRLMILMPPGSAKSTYAFVNTDLWGAYVPVPSMAGLWYAWVEGLDGSASTACPTGIAIT